MFGTAALAAALLVACSPAEGDTPASPSSDTLAPSASVSTLPATSSSAAERTFTLEELATYNGKDGQPAYVAVDGVVYDVTDVPEWANGEHKNGLTAGKDLTEEIKNQSPHGLSVLADLPVVGKLAA